MPLTVLNVGFPLARVGPDAVGGAEQVLWQLDRALAAAGHRSLVLAPEGSRVAGELLTVPLQAPPLDVAAWHRAHEAHRAALRAALAREPIDVVHLHGVDFHAYLPPPGPPALATLHLPAASYPGHALHPARPRTFLHCVSASQRAAFPPGTALLDDVPNGVDLGAFHPALGKGSYALALGRVCPDKGVHLALDAAARAGVDLVVAGAVHPFPEHLRYFEEEVRPRLDRRRRFVGPVGGARKRALLARARCLVVASQVAETTSLVALEALASGTPVVALGRGALREVVEHGRTGFLVDRPEELAAAILQASALSPADCRRAAEERFPLAETVRRYLALYDRLAGRDGAPASPRRAVPAPPAAPRAALRLEEVGRFEQLAAARGAWEELWARAPGATPFSSPAWLLPWCEHLATGPPRALLAWRGRDLAALLPVFTYRDGAARVLGLLGGGVSDYQDLVAEDGAAAEAALGWLADRQGAAFDRCDLRALPRSSLLLPAAEAAPLAAARAEDDLCSVLALPSRAAGLAAAGVSPGLLAGARYQLRRLGRDGDVAFVRADAASLPDLLADLFRLHRARWASRGRPGLLASGRLEAFHAAAARGLLAAGVLRLHALRLAGRTLGVLHGFTARGRAYAYLTGFAPEAAPRSPGSVLFAHAAEEAIAEGARELDFLRGREPYKRRWGAQPRTTWRLVLTPRAAARPSPAAPAPGSAPPSW
ncbi:GNAT family N-acetyltransferase [Anaeromyxobacter diazotrophicus]|uniref:Glycosyl transferase group 1 n=1 Tax=Anaeromyxobacter diazotrophicus TaxID=2590199 RepID=A0A7I9VP78_9BACT|nr:GNAT family N-acetyltransferase [Anaeromyxobacter diazotrophicus]GEJ58212.1 hypothetical protein AMYX_29530 [Anaeromyxobacter diazotrophicus]